MDSEVDAEWMDRALGLAARGRCGVSPNPMVGAVVLDRQGEPAGFGYHAAFGGDHAEIVALREAGPRARGGTLYVTLEPCNHTGKTPPCVDAILAASIRRLVVATPDPNPTAGGGLERLRAAGVQVSVGVCGEQARQLNRRWLAWIGRSRPWVSLKAAISLDGRIATRTGASQWITGSAARQRSLELREEHDAILVGVGTVLADDPRLTRRLGANPVDRWRRIILDSRLRTPPEAVVVRQEPFRTSVAHTEAAPAGRRRELNRTGVQLLELPATDSGQVDLSSLLDRLGAEEVAALLVEGGAAVSGSLVDADLIDEAYFFIAPLLIGGPAPAAVAGRGAASLTDALRLRFAAVDRCGEDLLIHAIRAAEEGCSPA